MGEGIDMGFPSSISQKLGEVAAQQAGGGGFARFKRLTL